MGAALEAILLLTPIWKYPISCSNYMYITLLSLPFTPSPMIPFSSLTLPPPLSPLHSPHSFLSLLQCLHIYSTLGMLHMSSGSACSCQPILSAVTCDLIDGPSFNTPYALH